MRAFVRTVDCKSLSAAAESLGASPSAVSKMISGLESDLGFRLLDRNARRTSLTEEGRSYLKSARQVVDAMTYADDLGETLRKRPQGILRICTMLTFAKYQLAPDLLTFIEQFPQLRLQFQLAATFEEIADTDFDVAIYSGSLPTSSLVSKKIASSRWIICAAPSYLAKHGEPTTPAELKRHRCLNFRRGADWNRWSFARSGGSFATEDNWAISSSQGELLLELAREGAGIVRLAEFHIERDLAAGNLVPLLEDHSDNRREPISVVYHAGRSQSLKIRLFLEFLQKTLASKSWNDRQSARKGKGHVSAS